ncbi:MAG: CPBP family intramembrane metalloprotease, partial [Anaerolineales bacterium]
TFGEEFGWRGYLQQKLLPMGTRTAMVWMGVIWGVWHWPMIAMGHNYGLDHLGAPWLGMVMMVWFTFTNGVFLSFVSLRSKSVWPAVICHAAINGIANIGALFLINQPNPLLGPLPVGLIGSAAWSALAIWLMVNPRVLAGSDT